MFKLVKRRVNENEAKSLANKIKETSNITGYSWREWIEFEHVIVAEDDDGQLAGVCSYEDFNYDWTFISVIFVVKEFRGKGVGKCLFQTACDDIISAHKKVYTSSKNPIIIKMMNDFSFVTFNTLFSLPEPYKKYEFIFIVRSIKWVSNFYRLTEIIRKSLKYGHGEKFTYGIKVSPNNNQ